MPGAPANLACNEGIINERLLQAALKKGRSQANLNLKLSLWVGPNEPDRLLRAQANFKLGRWVARKEPDRFLRALGPLVAQLSTLAMLRLDPSFPSLPRAVSLEGC